MTSSTIVLLILFILAAAALLLYYYLHHRLRSPPLPSSSAAVPFQSSHSSLRQVSPAPPPPSSSSAGILLPRFRFSDVTRPGSVTVTGDCAICLSEFKPDHHLRLLPLCLHAFHVDCIDTWLAGESKICPVCRAEVFRSDSDLLCAAASGRSFRVAIGSVSRGRAAGSSLRVHSIRGGEFEYVVDEEWELQLTDDAVLPVHGGGDDDEIIDVVIDGHPPISEYESSYGAVSTGSSRRWMDLSEAIEWISRFLKM